MKKLILFLSLAIMLFSCKPAAGQTESSSLASGISVADTLQDSSVEGTIDTYTGTVFEILLEKYSPQIREDVAKVLDKGKDLSEYSFEVVVKQSKIKGFINLLIMLFGFLATWLVWLKYKALRDDKDSDYESEDRWLFGLVMVCIIQFVVICCTLEPIFTGFFNPQYYAVKKFMEFLGNLI